MKSKRSLNRKSGYKRKSRSYLNRKWDGMMDNPSPKDPIIKLENYIDDIKLFYDKSFIHTISSFKMFKKNNEQNDTFDFIKELFNFHREDDINEIFYNKFTILGLIIISGLYDKFEKLIDGIQIIKNGGVSESKSNDDIIDCNTRKNDAFNLKTQHIEKLNKDQQQYLNEIIKTKLETFLKKITINRTTRKKFIKDSTINEIKKFIYYTVCIDSDIRKYIMRHYLLHFIKSEFSHSSSKDKILLDTSSDNEKNKEIIDRFLMNIGEFKKLPDISTKFTKKDNKEYSFHTCGETTLLNLLNYYFINDSGDFNPIRGSDELLEFYSEYNTMKKQLYDIRKTTNAWLKVVSNLKKSEEEKEVKLYNDNGDIHNNLKNIIFVLKTILGSEKDEITEILKSISPKHNIEIINGDENKIEFLLDGKFTIFFEPGHGDFIYGDLYNNNYKIEKIKDNSDDFSIMYNNIFETLNWRIDYNIILSFTIYLIFLKKTHLLEKPILKSFLNNIKKLDLQNNKLTTLPEEIGSLSSLEVLTLDNNRIRTIPYSIGNLTNLETFSLIDNQLTTLPDSIGSLSSLKELTLSYNQLTTLPDSIGELTNLKFLELSNNKLTTLPDSIGSLSSLKKLHLSYNQLTTLPDSIGSLSSLEELRLHNNNKLTTLPKSIGNLRQRSLKRFYA